MSKGNRIKGVYSETLGCRLASEERIVSLEERKAGITERHTPMHNPRSPKLTKSMRKNLNSNPRTGGSADGYMFIMNVLARGCGVTAA